MIPDFKTYIGESTWGDMRKRAEGDQIRKEDDVNLLDFDGLYAYVNKKYKDDVYKIKKGKLMGGAGQYCELFPIDENMWVSIFYRASGEIRNISIMWNDTVKESFIDKLGERFKTQDFFLSQYAEVQEKDGTVSNQTYIDLIDFVLSCSVKDVFITESTWGNMRKRAEGMEIRREDGIKVHTCIDVDIYLKNASDSYYDEFIKEIINYNDSYVDYRVAILNIRDKAYSTEEMKNIRAFEAPYAYLIYDGGHGTDLIAEFWTYDEMKDFDLDDFEDRVIEDDYISICKGIATKLKEVGGDIEYLPRNKGSFIGYDRKNGFRDISDYEGDYVLQLIDESDVYDWEIRYVDEYGEGSTSTCLEDFRESMIDTFPELDDVDFITWSYNNRSCNIGIPITAVTVKNFKKYKEYTKNWFTV